MDEQITLAITNEDVENLIIHLLREYKLADYEELDINLQRHLIKIEAYFQQCEVLYQRGKSIISKISLSLRGISENTKISRSTINKYDLLPLYINNRIKNLNCNIDIVPKKYVDSLKAEHKRLQDDLEVMVSNYLELGLLKNKITSIELEIKQLESERDLWQKERIEFNKQINELSSKLRSLSQNNLKEVNFKK